MIALDPRRPLALLLSLAFARLAGHPAPVACYCDVPDACECSGNGLARSERGCSCRCHGAETMPQAGTA